MIISVKSKNGEVREADLYSREGSRLVTELWIKSSFHHKVMYEPTWLGIPIIQYPNDIVMMQELIWKLRPDVIVETGVAHGGSAVLYASMLELLGKGKVIGVDIEIRKHNRLAINSHPLSRRIELVEGSSTAPEMIEDIRSRIPTRGEVLVVLDSNHSYEHVISEMELYKEFISPGGYMVVMDGVQEMLSDTPSGNKEWEHNNPLAAIREFLSRHPDWEEDSNYVRTQITCNPSGFLRRQEEI
jgi:cephalosporin hydroxylase